MLKSQDIWRNAFVEAEKTLHQFWNDSGNIEKCALFSTILTNCLQNKGTIFACGNGGSLCDSMHFAEELTGRYRKDRRPLGALALTDPAHLTCTANDYGFQFVFSRQIEALAHPGDALIALSTSGNSENLVLAIEAAKAKGVKTIALIGKDGGKIKNLVDLAIVVPAKTADRIQEMHIKLLHIVIETVERSIFPEHYA